MKLTLTDSNGAEHDLEAVIMGIVTDIHNLNKRLIALEPQPEEAHEEAPSEEIGRAHV